jgi:putative MATE family efflux protein
MLAMSLYNLVDTFWVGHLGYKAVAAVTVTLPYFILFSAIGLGTGIGVNALSSRRFGERNTEAAHSATGQVFFLCFALGVIISLVTILFPRQLLSLCGATADLLDLGESYLIVASLGMPLFLFNLVSRFVYQASGDAIRPMVFVIIGEICNAVLAPCLIFGWAFFPQMGIAGAALATLLANAVGAALALWFILTGRTPYQLRRQHFKPRFSAILAIYRVGLPAMFIQATEGIVFAWFNHLVAGFGSLALAAIGIITRIGDLAFLPLMGVANGLLPIIGFSFGARLKDRLWGTIKKASIWLAALMVVATTLLEIFTLPVLSLFNNDPDLLELAVPAMRIFFSSLMFIGPTLVFISAFQGLSKGRDAMFLSLARQFIFFIPGLYLGSYLLGLQGIWISVPISDFLGFLVAGFWLWREYRAQGKNEFWTKGIGDILAAKGDPSL